MAEDKDSKTEAPTGQKLAKAQGKGQFAKSQDLSQFVTFAAGAAIFFIGGGWFARNLANNLVPFWSRPDQIALDGGGLSNIGMTVVQALAPILATIFAVSAVGVILLGMFQGGGLAIREGALKFDLSRLNPIKGFQRLLKPDSVVQLGKSMLKLIATGGAAYMILKPHFTELQNLAAMSPAFILPFSMKLIRSLFMLMLIFLAVTALGDWMWQRYKFMQDMRMTKEEVKEEHKNTEGDPHVKAKQRQLRTAASRRRMMQNVPKATVVVMNPTHYAVALRYDDETPAPVCVAKGLDDLALRIRALAEESGVTVVEDPPLARSLYASVEIDEQIPVQHFEAVAKIISFIMHGKPAKTRARQL